MTVEIKGLGKITASEEVLNEIAYILDDCANLMTYKAMEHQGTKLEETYRIVGRMRSRQSTEIYLELNKTGYYNK